MNTFVKYAPNVWLACCQEQQEKGSTILVSNKYGDEKEYIVFNFIGTSKGKPCYSVIRADGYNAQERAKAKAERLQSWAASAEKKSIAAWEASHEGRDFLALAEPIKVGHHSEKRHRALIERNHNRMGKAVAFNDKAKEYESRAEYWAKRKNDINLSMPESIEYFEFELEKAKARQEGLKNGSIPRDHSFSLSYATKEVKELTQKVEQAKKLWA